MFYYSLPMMSKKDVISLIVESYGALAHEFRLVVEEGCQHPGEKFNK